MQKAETNGRTGTDLNGSGRETGRAGTDLNGSGRETGTPGPEGGNGNTEKCYADVIVDITSEQLDRSFCYRIPERMHGSIHAGSVVLVPFGKGNRKIRGYVTALRDQTSFDPEKIKEIEAVVTDGFDPNASMVALASWMKERYGCTMAQALRTVMPVRKAVREKESRYLQLTISREETLAALEECRKKKQKARERILQELIDQPQIPWELAKDKLHVTMAQLKPLQEKGILQIVSSREYRMPKIEGAREGYHIRLNDLQRSVADRIIASWEDPQVYSRTHLIHGITGSGKTEVYIELIAYAVSRGQQAIVLIPEIALTYQTVMRFYRRFGDRVSLINSRLSAGERFDQFQRASRGEIDVMIGPRSALFTPFPKLGIIVIDEEHERSYDSESSPAYHSVEVALKRIDMENATLVLGSATPSVHSYYLAKNGKIRLYEMKQRAGNAALARTEIVDLRQELQEGNDTLFSRRLVESIQTALDRREQVMLFLNRRGYAGFVSCRSCGHVPKCPHCDVSLSLHNNGRLICHYCGYTEPYHETCPECGSGLLRQFRAGTQQLEEQLKELFPEAVILRMDLDTTRGKDGHASILSAFMAHEADILIGTQMIVKGHDFPDVTLVGILAADLSLYTPDYRSSERTFQLLTQAAGRAGRSDKPGFVIIQTYDPQHYAITTAASQDYESFYDHEIATRTLAGYPPAAGLIAVHLSGPDETWLNTCIHYLYGFTKRLSEKWQFEILGPGDEPVARIQDIYRKVMYLKHPDVRVVLLARKKMEEYVEMNHGFDSITIRYENL